MKTIHEQLKELTNHVRKTQGNGKALAFYVDYIQPIKKYFGGDELIKEITIEELNTVSCMYCEKELKKDEAIILCKECTE